VDCSRATTRRWTQLAIAKPLCKAAYRVLHAEDIGVGIARAIRAAVSGRPGGVYLDLPASSSPRPWMRSGRKTLIRWLIRRRARFRPRTL